jgi:dTDP-4-amino-4,6-dideoxygalactose transaminase
MIPVAKPLLGEEEAAASRRAILSGWVTQGPEVEAFEQEWASMVGAPHACAVSNCTTGLHLALLVAGVLPGDEVITVSHSYIATVNAVRTAGALPIMVDIDPATYNISPQRVVEAITPKTRAILAVHQLGMPCDIVTLKTIASQHQLILIEDAACAIGSEIFTDGQWSPIGPPHADIACFSLHPRKVITTGDGGMITTVNAHWDAKLRLLRQHGMSISDKARHSAKTVLFESYPIPGFNYRMTDVQAAMGREQLKRLPSILARRREIAARYTAQLRGVTPPHQPTWARSNWQSYAVQLSPQHDQQTVMQAMLDDGIATRRGVMCSHREQACADLPLRHDLSASEHAQDHSIILPLYPQMTDDEQDRVITSLHHALHA